MIEPLEVRDNGGDVLRIELTNDRRGVAMGARIQDVRPDLNIWFLDRAGAERIRDWLNDYLRESEG